MLRGEDPGGALGPKAVRVYAPLAEQLRRERDHGVAGLAERACDALRRGGCRRAGREDRGEIAPRDQVMERVWLLFDDGPEAVGVEALLFLLDVERPVFVDVA